MPSYVTIPFVRVNFNDGTFVVVEGKRARPLKKTEANELQRKYTEQSGKLVISVERVDCTDIEYETYGYNLKGDCIVEYRKED